MTPEPAVEEQDVVPYRADAALVTAYRYRAAGPALAGWIMFTGWLWLPWHGPALPALAVSAAAALFVPLLLLRPDPERRGALPAPRGPWVTRAEAVSALRRADVATHVSYAVRAIVLATLLCTTCLWADQQADVGAWSAVGVASSAGGAMVLFGLMELVRLLRTPGRDLRTVALTVSPDDGSDGRKLLLRSDTLTWSAERRGLLADARPGDLVVGHLRPGSADLVAVTADGRRSLVEAHARADGGRREGSAS